MIPRAKNVLPLLASVPCLALPGCEARAAEPPPPSVILISLDTLRAGHMSVYGYQRETTPYLEKLARESLVFDQAFASSCWTLIAHVSMLTGLYPNQHGVTDRDLAISPEAPLLAERLQERGYQTFGFYKPGFIGEEYGHQRGFDVFVSHERAHQAEANMEDALPDIHPNRPFFLFLHLFDIHSAPMYRGDAPYYRPPSPYDTIFEPDAKERLKGVNFRAVHDNKARLTADQRRAMVTLYDGNIRYVDAKLEKWIEGWREQGLLDRAILIITADHGESLGQRFGRISGHGRMFQDALDIPLIIRFPDGRHAGERTDTVAHHVDIVPTALDYLGLSPDPNLPGYSLLGEVPEDRVVVAGKPPLAAKIQLPFKVVSGNNAPRWVYQLEKDPLEIDPLTKKDEVAAKDRELAVKFREELGAKADFKVTPVPAGEADAALVEELKAMGYIGDGD